MKYVYLTLSGLFFAAWIYLGNTPGVGGAPIPAIGKFFNPAKGFWQNGKTQLLGRSDTRRLSLGHPLAKGEIFFDELGIPHIFGEDMASVAFLQGYVNAADRMWQMDISTRATEGTLSEVLGARTRARDIGQVSRGYRMAAQRAVDSISLHFPEEFGIIEAYAQGVNAYLDQLAPEDYPVEYKLLGHTPIRWSPYRTALLMKGMSQSLSGRSDDVEEAKTIADLGDQLFEALYPERFPDADPIVPASGTYKRRAASGGQGAPVIAPLTTMAPAAPATSSATFGALPSAGQGAPYGPELISSDEPVYTVFAEHPDNGSNNWAIAGSRSNTGAPLLASDPHLSLTLPSIWSEVQLHFPGVNARGVSLPGAPGIMIGFNDYVAYGETNVGHDVTDWFKIEWTDSTRTTYLLDGEEVAANVIVDTILVRGEAPIILKTPWTIFGPVPYTKGRYADYAMRYLAHDAPGKNLRSHALPGTFLKLLQARNYEDYREALQGYADPAQNFVFAEKGGDIAIRPNGFFPVRAQGNGRFPLAGNTRANAWQGYLPFADRPEHKNPRRGFVASANQVTAAADFAYNYHGGFGEYRGRYINRHLRKAGQLTQRDMKELQLDSYSLLAEELTPLMIARINRNALTAEGGRLLRLLSEWDYRCRADSRAATLFHDWQSRLYRLTFDEIPRDSGYILPDLWRWNDIIAETPDDPIFDIDSTSFRETAATLTQRAFDEILEELDGALPKPWSEARNTRIRHLGAIPGFGTGLIVSGGSRQSPRALSAGHGASWRMVVELGETPRAWGVLPGGASGAPGSPSYDNGVDDWANGRYHELIRWNGVAEATEKAAGRWTFE